MKFRGEVCFNVTCTELMKMAKISNKNNLNPWRKLQHPTESRIVGTLRMLHLVALFLALYEYVNLLRKLEEVSTARTSPQVQADPDDPLVEWSSTRLSSQVDSSDLEETQRWSAETETDTVIYIESLENENNQSPFNKWCWKTYQIKKHDLKESINKSGKNSYCSYFINL